MHTLIDDKAYLELVNDIKRQIAETQRDVLFSANKGLITLYWNIGKAINEKSSWGSKFVENLSKGHKLGVPENGGILA